MSKLSIFVSSTCYDLRALREHIRESIKLMGHEAILSDHDGFPVSPDQDTVSNCRKVIEQHADVLVLIIGGRYGYISGQAKLSVTNLEYIEARKKGIDCIVFVDSAVWNSLPIYEKNPTADFSSVVDNPMVFSFIDSIKKENRWIFRFERTAEIITVLRDQLSIRLRDLLRQAREGRLTIPANFKTESKEVIELLLTKPRLWEYKLTLLLLEDRIRSVDSRFNDLEDGLIVRRTRRLAGKECMDHVHTLLDDQIEFCHVFEKIFSEITISWGPPGVSGDANLIKKVCDNLHSLGVNLFEWELDLRFVKPEDQFAHLFELLTGWTSIMLEQLRVIPAKVRELIETVENGGTKFHFHVKLEAPSNLPEVTLEMKRLYRNNDWNT